MEELQDVYQHFLLYYSHDLDKMKTAMKAARRKQRELRRLEREAAGADDAEHDDVDDDDDDANDTAVKHAHRKSGYTMCIEAGLGQSRVIIVFSLLPLCRSTLLNRLNKVGLKCPSAGEYVRPSTKSFFDFSDWHVGRG